MFRLAVGDYEERSWKAVLVEDGEGLFKLASQPIVKREGNNCWSVHVGGLPTSTGFRQRPVYFRRFLEPTRPEGPKWDEGLRRASTWTFNRGGSLPSLLSLTDTIDRRYCTCTPSLRAECSGHTAGFADKAVFDAS